MWVAEELKIRNWEVLNKLSKFGLGRMPKRDVGEAKYWLASLWGCGHFRNCWVCFLFRESEPDDPATFSWSDSLDSGCRSGLRATTAAGGLSSNFTSPELDGLDKQRSRVKIFSEGNPNHLTSELDLGPVSRWSERAM